MLLVTVLVFGLRLGLVLGAEGGPQVELKTGTLRGKKIKSELTSKEFYAFRGIPYAKTPTGERRFKAPEPSESWTGVKDVDNEGEICPQKQLMGEEAIGNEDCLFLNVYSPQLSGPAIPVMVWIHGGGFAMFSGNANIYGPDYLLANGVVIVTMNYRLGTFGFLTVPGAESEISGNMGLKDQTMAMKWVKDNIDKFGGDPNKITIFGESSGSASVHYHVLSPMSKGLFHQAISQSGSVLNPWVFRLSPQNNTLQVATYLGCKDTEPKAMVACFMKAPTDKLALASVEAHSDEDMRHGMPFPCIPTLDGTFLPKEPHQILAEGSFNKVPFLIGFNTGEGIFAAKHVINNQDSIPIIDKSMKYLVPPDLNLTMDSEAWRTVTDKMRDFYLKGKEMSEDNYEAFVKIMTDTKFIIGIHQAIQLQDKFSKPIFYYKFAYEGAMNIFKPFYGASDMKGVCHADELGYLFYMEKFGMTPEPNSTELNMLNRMVTMWTNFAKMGNPTPDTSDLLPVKWEPFTNSNPVYLNINKELSLKSELKDENIVFWDAIYNAQKTS